MLKDLMLLVPFCLQLAPILIMGLILEQILIQQLISLKIKHSLPFSAGASVGMNLFSGLTNWRRLQRAKLSKVASEYRLDKMKDDISLMVANSFYRFCLTKKT